MSTSPQAWLPAGQDLSREQSRLLSVPARAKPTLSLYLDLLARKLQALIDADPKEAQWAMEMSQEQAPELWMIAENEPRQNWGQALTLSDSMQALLNQVDWTLPGTVREAPTDESLREILEQIP